MAEQLSVTFGVSNPEAMTDATNAMRESTAAAREVAEAINNSSDALREGADSLAESAGAVRESADLLAESADSIGESAEAIGDAVDSADRSVQRFEDAVEGIPNDAGGVQAPARTPQQEVAPLPANARGTAQNIVDEVSMLYDNGGGVDSSGNVYGVNTSMLDIVPIQHETTEIELADSRGLLSKITNALNRRETMEIEASDNQRMFGRAINAITSNETIRLENLDEATTQSIAKMDNLGKGVESLTDFISNGKGGKNALSEAIDFASGGLNKLGGVLEGVGGTEGVVAVLGRFAGALGVASAAVALVEAGIDAYQQAKDVAVSQTGSAEDITLGAREWFDVRMRTVFNGLSEEEASNIQKGLIAGRAPFGSQQYSEGFAFSQNARLNYGLEASKATDLYVKAVVRGQASVNELNEALEALAKTAGESDATMSELVETFTSTVNTLEGIYGQKGVEIGVDLGQMGLSPEENASFGALISNTARLNTYGSLYNQTLTEVSQWNGGGAKAYGIASLEAISLGTGISNQDYANLALSGVIPYLQEAVANYKATGEAGIDWDDFESQLEEVFKDEGLGSVVRQTFRNIGIAPAGNEETAAGYRKTLEGMFSGLESESASGVIDNAGIADIKDAASGGVGESSNVLSQAGMAEWNVASAYMQDVSQREGERFGENMQEILGGNTYTNANLDTMRAALINSELVSAEDFRGMSDETMYDMLRDVAADFKESGFETFGEYANANRELLAPALESYTSAFSEVKNKKEADEVKIELEVRFQGGLGEYIEIQRQNYVTKKGLDDGNA